MKTVANGTAYNNNSSNRITTKIGLSVEYPQYPRLNI